MHDILNDIETELSLMRDGRINDAHSPVELLKRAKAEIRHLRNLVRMGYEAENEAHNAINLMMRDVSRFETCINNYLNAREFPYPEDISKKAIESALGMLAHSVGRVGKTVE